MPWTVFLATCCGEVFGPLERGPHIGVDKARVDPDDEGALGFELNTQTVGHGAETLNKTCVRRARASASIFPSNQRHVPRPSVFAR